MAVIKKLKIGDALYEFNATQLEGHAASYYATKAELDAHITKVTGALLYKGTLLTTEVTTGYTPAAEKGDVYVVAVAGTVNGLKCEAGDLWLCHTAVAAGTSATAATVNQSWDVVQANIDVAALEAKFAKASHKHSVTAAGTVGTTEYTPAGSVSQPTFTGTAAGHNHTVESHEAHTFNGTGVELVGTFTGTQKAIGGTVTAAGTVGDASITPAGTVAVSTRALTTDETADVYVPDANTGSNGGHAHTGSVSIEYTPAGTIAISKAASGTANYTPAGTVASNGAHTHNVAVSIDYTPAGSVAEGGGHTHTVSASGKFTPAGSITTPTTGGTGHTHSVTVGTTSVLKSVSGELTGSLDGDTLVLAHTITQTPATVVNSVGSTTGSTALGFSGTTGDVSVSGTAATGGAHTHSFTGTKTTLSQTATAASAGAHTHTFTGTGAVLVGTFTGTGATLTDDFTTNSTGAHTHTMGKTGKKLQATFTGTAASHKHTFTGSSANVSGNYTPSGSVKISVGTGTANYTPSGSITATAKTLTVSTTSITPAGTVSKPTFTGTKSSHSHTFAGTAVDSGTEK